MGECTTKGELIFLLIWRGQKSRETTLCNVSIAIVKLPLISKKSPRVNNKEIMRNGIISVYPVSHCVPLCSLCPPVSHVSNCVSCPIVSFVSPSVPCAQFYPLCPLCDNVCLVVVRCTSKTRKNIYLNCLPVFSKYIHSNNCFVEFRIS